VLRPGKSVIYDGTGWTVSFGAGTGVVSPPAPGIRSTRTSSTAAISGNPKGEQDRWSINEPIFPVHHIVMIALKYGRFPTSFHLHGGDIDPYHVRRQV
jgi:hypothetical protein